MMPRVSIDEVVDRVIDRERAFVLQMKHMHPLAETYIQNLKTDKEARWSYPPAINISWDVLI